MKIEFFIPYIHETSRTAVCKLSCGKKQFEGDPLLLKPKSQVEASLQYFHTHATDFLVEQILHTALHCGTRAGSKPFYWSITVHIPQNPQVEI